MAAANGTDDQPAATDHHNARPLAQQVLDPQLLMAACSGNRQRLKELLPLKKETEAAAAAEVVIVDVTPRRPPAPTTAPAPPPPPPSSGSGSASLPPIDGCATMEWGTLLHLVASCGDGDDFLHCARMIYHRAKPLLVARDDKGDSPLHCAAGAGNANMVSCLLDLAGTTEEVGAVTALVRMENKCGETALHQAVRAAKNKLVCIDHLLDADPELACIPHEVGGSPFYLAISLSELDIARHLFRKTQGRLSYSGPQGRNVLHAAVSCGHVKALPMVLQLLMELKTGDGMQQDGGQADQVRHETMGADDVLSQLTSQRDLENGSTPLHMAASLWGLPSTRFLSMWSWGRSGPSATRLLLDANASTAYLPDKEGLYPVHVAAGAGSFGDVKALLRRCPGCATLRDAKGRTFLHVAAEKGRLRVVRSVCRSRNPLLSSILNAQDINGDTAVHRAVFAGNLGVFRELLFRNQQVRLDVPNFEGMRPIDVSWSTMPMQTYFSWNPRMRIRRLLLKAVAPYGESRGDLFDKRHAITSVIQGGEDKISENLTAAAQVMGIFSVLITTVTFASAFTLPGGYRSDVGTPVLAGSYAFDAFVLADALAFVCSFLATFLLLYIGVPAFSLDSRFANVDLAYDLMMNSGRCLVAAFALGLYVPLFPVARTIPIAIAVCWMTMLATVFVKASEGIDYLFTFAIIPRRRKRSALQLVSGFIVMVLQHFWSYILIFGIPAIRKLARAR